MWRVGFVMLLSLAACSRASRASAPSSDDATNAVASSRGVDAPHPNIVAIGEAGAPPESSPGWVTAIRRADWPLAEQLLATLPESSRSQPRVRYARARVALSRKDFVTARDELAGLEAALPELKQEIEQYRAEAQLEAGPFAAAALYFVERDDAGSLGRAALAYMRGGEPDKGLQVVNRAVALAEKSDRKSKRSKRLAETEARFVRAQIAGARGRRDIELSDLIWILTQDPLSERAVAAEAIRAAKYPKHHLIPEQRLARAQLFSRAGDIDATERELESLNVPAKVGAPLFATLLRAWAHYFSRSSYAKAAELLSECAMKGGADRPKLLFHAARALSRAGQDAQAIQKYRDFVRSYPNNGYAEEAGYLVGRLYYIAGEWKKADQAYTEYLQRFARTNKRKGSRARFATQARYEQSVTRLIVKRPTVDKDFATLSFSAEDPFERARLLELQAVSLIEAKPMDAVALLRQVVEQWPLSLPALLAEAHLREMGSEPPASVVSAPSRSDVDPEPLLAAKLPQKAELLHDIGFDADAEAALSEVEDSLRREYEPRGGEVLCELYGLLNSAKRRYSLGRRLIKRSALLEPPTLATRWAWECVYPRAHRDIVDEVEKAEGLPQSLIYAVMRQESAFDSKAVSSAGAVGLMQMMPDTAEHVATELGLGFDRAALEAPAHNIRIAGRYLHNLSKMFDGQLAIEIAAYNAGPHAVSRWLEHGEDLPLDLWIARIPYAETRGYVVRVLSNLVRYDVLRSGSNPVDRVELKIPPGLRAEGDAY